ncbi:hypothetical protein, conserved, partial [Plasmodium ovale curtisi]
MLREKLSKILKYYYFIRNYYIYHILFVYTFFLRITYTYADITISHLFTFLLNKYENVETPGKEDNFFYYFTHFFNFNTKNDDKFLNTKLFVVVYLPICLKCFYTLFFDYIAYYIYIHYYFNKINNDFKKVYYSSMSYESTCSKTSNHGFLKKKKKKLYTICKKKKYSYDDSKNMLYDMSIYGCRKHLQKKKKKKSQRQDKNSFLLVRKKRNNSWKKDIFYEENMNGKDKCVKVITCKNSFFRYNLPSSSRKDLLGRRLFFRIFKNKKNIFFRRKNRKGCRDVKENFHFGNSTCKETKWNNDNSVLSKAYVNLKSNFVLLDNDSMENMTRIAMRERSTCIEEEKQKGGVIPSSYSYKDSALENDSLGPFDETRERSKLLQFQLEKKKGSNYTNLENGKDEKMINNLTIPIQLNTSDIDYVILKEDNLEMYKNDNNNFEELCFGSGKENVIRILKKGSFGDIQTGEKVEKRSEKKGTCANISEKKKSYKTLRGSLKMDYLFKDSCELMENNTKLNDSYEYYYYNKYKNFQYGKHYNVYNNRREYINNKINVEYYNNKDNILNHHKSVNFTTTGFGMQDVSPPVNSANAFTFEKKKKGDVHHSGDILTTHITPVVIDMDDEYRAAAAAAVEATATATATAVEAAAATAVEATATAAAAAVEAGGGEHMERINIDQSGKHGGYENFYSNYDKRKEYKCNYRNEYSVEEKKTEKDYNNSLCFFKSNFYNEDMFRKNILSEEINKRRRKPIQYVILSKLKWIFKNFNILKKYVSKIRRYLKKKGYIKNLSNDNNYKLLTNESYEKEEENKKNIFYKEKKNYKMKIPFLKNIKKLFQM